jgi:flagellar biosynthesis/type III secretory pathway protein FliH
VTHHIPIRFTQALRGMLVSDDASLASTLGPAAKVEDAEAARRAEVDKEAQEERLILDRLVTSLAEAALELRTHQQQFRAEMQEATVKLSLAVASRLIHEKLEAGEFNLGALVREVVERLGTRHAVKVHLHPADLALLRKQLPDPSEVAWGHHKLEFCSDPLVGRGGCRADAGDVSVLSQLDLQIAELQQNLLRSVTCGPSESE